MHFRYSTCSNVEAPSSLQHWIWVKDVSGELKGSLLLIHSVGRVEGNSVKGTVLYNSILVVDLDSQPMVAVLSLLDRFKQVFN